MTEFRPVSSASETGSGLNYKMQRFNLFYTKPLKYKVRTSHRVGTTKHPQEISAAYDKNPVLGNMQRKWAHGFNVKAQLYKIISSSCVLPTSPLILKLFSCKKTRV